MPTYNLIKDFSSQDDPDSISVAPYWLVCFIGLQTPLSYSRKSRKSITANATQGARSKIIVTNDCNSLSINLSKESHTKVMQMSLLQGEINYLIEVLPGDWIMTWTFNDETKFKEVLGKVKNGEQANDFADGLKFVGRVNSIRKNMSLGTDGTKSSVYNVDAYSFRELDAQFFYDTALAENLLKNTNSLAWLARIGIDIKNVFEAKDGVVTKDNAHLLVSALLKILIGSGIKSESVDVINNSTGIKSSAGSTTEEAPFAYIVPGEIAKLLGKTQSDASKKSKIVSFADLLELYTGVQSYENTDSNSYTIFNPKTQSVDGIERFSGKANLGSFQPVFIGFANRPVWSVLQQFTNPVVNELFTCLRVNEDGKVVPQVVFRQIPFTTPAFAEINGQRLDQETIRVLKTNFSPRGDAQTALTEDEQNTQNFIDEAQDSRPQIPVTPFHNLPRWKLHPVMVKSISLGRSDALRTNFIHVYGQNAQYSAGSPNMSQQLVQNPPPRNDLDIQLNGLRSFMSTVASDFIDQVGKTPSSWMDLISDYMIGAHLTLNGTIETCGIHMPICEGDNLEWDGMVFHIESISHRCGITPDGMKSFSTVLNITNGLRISDFDSENGDTDLQNTFYPGLKVGDAEHYDPGITVDSQYEQLVTKSKGNS